MSNLVADVAKQLIYLQLIPLLLFLRVVYVVVYRLYFHPLKSFPGPRLAAITKFYEGYFVVWKNGMFVRHVEKLHETYGPVVRVGPNDLHFSSAEAFFAIYPSHSGFTKDPTFYKRFGCDGAIFGTIDVQEHRQRREVLNPLFSRRSILKLQNLVQEKVDLFLDQIRTYHAEPVNLSNGFRALAMDIVTAFSYAHSFGALVTPGFDHPIMRSVEGTVPLHSAIQFLPFLQVLQHLPPWLHTMMNPDFGGAAQMRSFLEGQVDGILNDPDSLKSVEHETIYHHLITPELVKKGELPSKKALVDEAMVLLVAGTDTSSNAMTVGLCHLLLNDHAKQKLQAELQTAWPEKDTPFSYEMAEKLPYLTGVIKEALRLSTGVPVPLPRIVTVPTVIDGTPIPAETVVSIAQPFVLKNPDIFPDPLTFKPERWTGPDSQKLDKYLVVFSKGPRSCLGMNLAWCELYLTFAHLMRKLDMQLYETSLEDMIFRDHMVPLWKDVRPLQIIVKEQVV